MCPLLHDFRLFNYNTLVFLVPSAGCVRTTQLSPRTPFKDVATSMGLWDGAPSPAPIDGGRWCDLFPFFFSVKRLKRQMLGLSCKHSLCHSVALLVTSKQHRNNMRVSYLLLCLSFKDFVSFLFFHKFGNYS